MTFADLSQTLFLEQAEIGGNSLAPSATQPRASKRQQLPFYAPRKYIRTSPHRPPDATDALCHTFIFYKYFPLVTKLRGVFYSAKSMSSASGNLGEHVRL